MQFIRSARHETRSAIERAWFSAQHMRWRWIRHFSGLAGINLLLEQGRSIYARDLLLRFGARVGDGSDLNTPLLVNGAWRDYSNLKIGQFCHIGKGVLLDLCAPLTVEDCAIISMGTTILTHIDMGHSPLGVKAFPPRSLPVVIKQGAYLGAAAIILGGTTVGRCAVVGAGAVVVNDIPDGCVAVGVPARVVRTLDIGREEG
jgi:acetyltransferase-like isoleucine patch superfamily enzyme